MSEQRELVATVRDHDTGTRTGSVLLDDGRALRYDADTFDTGGLRLLRLGQRVRLRLDGDPVDPSTRVTGITVLTLDW